ncbi:anthranilate synthase component I family protein [Alienimonas californiensis]|uniref:Aminodeoxychorismate synthase component 1 n=1 Tax=Alienimonas californiensis TaxID=2527989 RepID=A0A517PF54_9PLAN|nr:anthranilate synthase component I family protein [Alienimonas californiensis]QDT17995.1 Aminodeoxychorismate synthase component 1 [Alienimonas californiensis]
MTTRPLVHELTPPPTVPAALSAFADCGPVLFDSSATDDPRGRFSYLTADVRPASAPTVRYALKAFETERVEGLPPFQGGAVGLWCYEEGRRFERLPEPKTFAVPERGREPRVTLGPGRSVTAVADWVLAWDHAAGRAWVVSQGGPDPHAPHGVRQEQLAERRLAAVLARLEAESPPPLEAMQDDPVTPDLPRVPGWSEAFGTFTRPSYEATVARAVEYVRAGDVFQVNLAQPLLVPAASADHWRTVYHRLRMENPAPFGGVFAAGAFGDAGAGGDGVLLSASPERFLSVTPDREGRMQVESRPIKGTRPRPNPPGSNPGGDAAAAAELQASAKDRAENVMIVDLLRNDLSRVCEPGSVRVPALCELESYASVHHLVSEVRGTLRPECDAWDLLAAAFPGGSITGAPKVRAMEIIHELEPFARGLYCGSQFWIGFDGAMDSNILIRTAWLRDWGAIAWVGGGVTAQSDPAAEYEETLHKASATLRALCPSH